MKNEHIWKEVLVKQDLELTHPMSKQMHWDREYICTLCGCRKFWWKDGYTSYTRSDMWPTREEYACFGSIPLNEQTID